MAQSQGRRRRGGRLRRVRAPASSPSATSCARSPRARTPTSRPRTTTRPPRSSTPRPRGRSRRPREAMMRGGFRHLVVLDGSEVAGMLSVRDIVRQWASQPGLTLGVRRATSLGGAYACSAAPAAARSDRGSAMDRPGRQVVPGGALARRAADARGDDPGLRSRQSSSSICDVGHRRSRAAVYVVEPDDVHLRLAAAAACDPAATSEPARRARRAPPSASTRACPGEQRRRRSRSCSNFVTRRRAAARLRGSASTSSASHLSHTVALRVPGRVMTSARSWRRAPSDAPPFNARRRRAARAGRRGRCVRARAQPRCRRRVARQADILDRVADAVARRRREPHRDQVEPRC